MKKQIKYFHPEVAWISLINVLVVTLIALYRLKQQLRLEQKHSRTQTLFHILVSIACLLEIPDVVSWVLFSNVDKRTYPFHWFSISFRVSSLCTVIHLWTSTLLSLNYKWENTFTSLNTKNIVRFLLVLFASCVFFNSIWISFSIISAEDLHEFLLKDRDYRVASFTIPVINFFISAAMLYLGCKLQCRIISAGKAHTYLDSREEKPKHVILDEEKPDLHLDSTSLSSPLLSERTPIPGDKPIHSSSQHFHSVKQSNGIESYGSNNVLIANSGHNMNNEDLQRRKSSAHLIWFPLLIRLNVVMLACCFSFCVQGFSVTRATLVDYNNDDWAGGQGASTLMSHWIPFTIPTLSLLYIMGRSSEHIDSQEKTSMKTDSTSMSTSTAFSKTLTPPKNSVKQSRKNSNEHFDEAPLQDLAEGNSYKENVIYI